MRASYIKPGIPCSSDHYFTINKRLNFIEKNLIIHQNQKILDIGVGYGAYIGYFSGNDHIYIGIDIIKDHIGKIKSLYGQNIDLFLMSGENIGFRDNLFDIIFLIEVFEHIPDDEKILEEIFRVLAPNGKLVITAPNKLFPFETHGFKIGSRHYGTYGLGFPILPLMPYYIRKHIAVVRVYSIGNLKKMLEKNGFLIKKIDYLGPGLDQLNKYFPRLDYLIHYLKKIFLMIENSVFKGFLTTIIIIAEKGKK